MSTVLTIYHNPQCTKSRNALQLLEENKDKHNYQVQIVQYKKEPLNRQQLETLVDYLGLSEDNFRVLLRPEVQKSVSSLNEAIELILREPQQLERPFVIDTQHKKAALGRPDLSGIEALIANL